MAQSEADLSRKAPVDFPGQWFHLFKSAEGVQL